MSPSIPKLLLIAASVCLLSVPSADAGALSIVNPTITVRYFDSRGLGEPIRMALHVLGLEFKQVRYSSCNNAANPEPCPEGVEDWSVAKPLGIKSGLFPFGQVPSMTYQGAGDKEPVNLVQSKVILDFLARRHAFGVDASKAKNDPQVELALIRQEMLVGGIGDVRTRYGRLSYNANAATDDGSIVKAHEKDLTEVWLPKFEAMLNGAKYFVNDKISFVDVLAFDMIDSNWRAVGNPTLMDTFPGLKALAIRVANHQGLRMYLKRRIKYSNGNTAAIDTPSNPVKFTPSYPRTIESKNEL